MDKETALDMNAAKQEELDEVVRCFAKAAVRASRAGYDGVQIHSAHSYLLSSSLSPAQNEREDEYGPCTAPQYKGRLVEEVIQAVRAALDEELTPRERQSFLLGVKLQTEDHYPNGRGLLPEDAAHVAARIAPLLSFLEISGGAIFGPSGTLLTMRTGPARFYYQRSLEEFAKLGVCQETTVIVTGGLRDVADFDKALDLGAEMVGMSRPFYRDFRLVERIADEICAAADSGPGSGSVQSPKTGCFSCNRCCQRRPAGGAGGPRCPFTAHDI